MQEDVVDKERPELAVEGVHEKGVRMVNKERENLAMEGGAHLAGWILDDSIGGVLQERDALHQHHHPLHLLQVRLPHHLRQGLRFRVQGWNIGFGSRVRVLVSKGLCSWELQSRTHL